MTITRALVCLLMLSAAIPVAAQQRKTDHLRPAVTPWAASTPAVRSAAPTPNANDASPLLVQSAAAHTTARVNAPKTTSDLAKVSG